MGDARPFVSAAARARRGRGWGRWAGLGLAGPARVAARGCGGGGPGAPALPAPRVPAPPPARARVCSAGARPRRRRPRGWGPSRAADAGVREREARARRREGLPAGVDNRVGSLGPREPRGDSPAPGLPTPACSGLAPAPVGAWAPRPCIPGTFIGGAQSHSRGSLPFLPSELKKSKSIQQIPHACPGPAEGRVTELDRVPIRSQGNSPVRPARDEGIWSLH